MMSSITNYFASMSFSQTLGWTLFHFVWQGLLLAALIALLLGMLSKRSANARYLVACCGLVLMAVCPVITFGWLHANQTNASETSALASTTSYSLPLEQHSVSGSTSNSAVDSSVNSQTNSIAEAIESVENESSADTVGTVDFVEASRATSGVVSEWQTIDSASTVSTWGQQLQSVLQPWIPWFVGLWLAGVLLLSVRMLVCWLRVNRLKTTGAQLDDSRVSELFRHISERIGLSGRVRLVQSSSVVVPTVIGWSKPVVLLPASVLTGLSTQQLSAVIAHELAHVRRADYLVNLFQSVIETVLFYHPAVWWLSSRIRAERENCCDDLAADVCGSPREYAEALLKLEQLKSSPALAMGADGASLLDRVARLLGKSRNQATGPYWLAGCGSLLIAIVALSMIFTDQTAQADAVSNTGAETEKVDDADVVQEEETEEDKTIVIKVLDENGEPMEGVHIHAGIWSKDRSFPPNQMNNTDAEGRVTVSLPDEFYILRLWASADGYARLFKNWEEDNIKNGDTPPADYTFRMIKGATIGGVIVDQKGDPIAGAAIGVQASATHPGNEDRLRFGSWYADEKSSDLVTDDQGRWSLDTLPPADDLKVTVKTAHPEYIDDPRGESYEAQGITTADLLAGTARIVMNKGVAVSGNIVDSDGNPVENGLVVWGDSPYWDQGPNEVRIGLEGAFELPALPPGKKRITVVAPGFQPETRVITIEPMMEDVDFKLEGGESLTIRVVDGKTGEPIPGAYIGVERWRYVQTIYNYQHPNVIDSGIPFRADEFGVYRWTWAPADEVKYSVSAEGYAQNYDVKLTASTEMHTVELFKPLSIAGDVVSKATGERIESFTITPLFYPDVENEPENFIEQKSSMERGKQGRFRIEVDMGNAYRYKIESPGFEPFITDLFTLGDEIPRQKIELKKATWRNGVVIDAAGNPVKGADVKLASKTKIVSVQKYLPHNLNATPGITTDENGAFAFPHSKVPETLLVLTKSGYAEVVKQPGEDFGEIQLQPWVSVQGTVYDDAGEPVPNVKVAFEGNRFQYDHIYHIQDLTAVTTDRHGKFVFPKLPPIKGVIRALSHMTESIRNEHVVPVDLNRDESYEINLGAPAITVSGVFNVTGRTLSEIDYTPVTAVVMPVVQPPYGLPEMLADKNLDWKNGWKEVQLVTQSNHFWTGRTYLNSIPHCKVKPESNGYFSVQVTEPGTYDIGIELEVRAKELGNGVFAHSLGAGTLRFEVDEAAIKAGKLDLGKIDVAAFSTLKPGGTVPDFEFQNADGATTRLSEHHGQYLLLDFWAAWCESCAADTSRLQELADALLKADSSARMMSIEIPGSGPHPRASDKTSRVWTNNKIIYERGKTIEQEYNQIFKKLGVSALPTYLIIDPQGKLVYQGNIDGAIKKMQALE